MKENGDFLKVLDDLLATRQTRNRVSAAHFHIVFALFIFSNCVAYFVSNFDDCVDDCLFCHTYECVMSHICMSHVTLPALFQILMTVLTIVCFVWGDTVIAGLYCVSNCVANLV